jgi:hypothetical protein
VYGVDIATAARRQGKDRSWRWWRGTRGGASSCAGGGKPGEGPVLAPAEGDPEGRGSRDGGEGGKEAVKDPELVATAGRLWRPWSSHRLRGGSGPRAGG